MKRKGCLLLSFLMLLGLAGCTASGELQDFQGKWFDVNGETVLDFNGNNLTVTWRQWTDKYTVHLEQDGSLRYIASDKDYDFGVMSRLEIRNDGTLWAYEQILDGEGHTYHFVREEALAAEKEIRDESKDLPKTIESGEIDEFSLTLKIDGVFYDLDEDWPHGVFSWTMNRNDDGTYQNDVDIMGDSYIAARYQGTEDAAYAEGVADLIQELELPALNGYYKTNNVQKHSYSLYVKYTSGEKLRIGASGDAAEECPFDVNALMAYVKDKVLENPAYY
ncbi:MAG: hypothetical protein IKR10_07480 [Firmicutes bacterium]|nr:hypothetical protein [Bacillota bacterium]